MKPVRRRWSRPLAASAALAALALVSTTVSPAVGAAPQAHAGAGAALAAPPAPPDSSAPPRGSRSATGQNSLEAKRAVMNDRVGIGAQQAAGAAAKPAAPAALPDVPPPSDWIGTIDIPYRNSVVTKSEGDLWPNCWAADDAVYAAWGDGAGFAPANTFVDVGTARITGDVNNLSGSNTATADGVSQVWTKGGFTRKPTGMTCVGNTLYLAVQDLAINFDQAPAATIVKSTDGGKTWTWDKRAPMFPDHVFTTIWFADYGKGGGDASSPDEGDKYVYAYGLDGNWRESPPPFNTVPDPQDVFLARVPKDKVQQRLAWQFFSGYRADGTTPTWSKRISDKKSVLRDTRRDYPLTFNGGDGEGLSVISQGGVVYNKALGKYIYTSWSEFNYHFYESDTPWGPWSRMADQNFTSFDDRAVQYGGYGTTFPSKFISADGKTMWLQSNRCCPGQIGYSFALRKVQLEPAQDGVANPAPSDANLARDPGTQPISRSVRQASLAALNDGVSTGSIDDYDGEIKNESFWGYTWPQSRRMNQLTFTTGTPAADGGWFVAAPRVQYREDGVWKNVPGALYTTPFKPGAADGTNATYTVQFPPVTGDGIRIVGAPGGDHRYSSIAEISVGHRAGQLIDGGFENTGGYGEAWTFRGTAPHGIDNGCCSRTGKRNAWVRTQEALGPQYVEQTIAVTPGSTIDVSAWIRTFDPVTTAYLGLRWDGGENIAKLTTSNGEYRQYQHSVTVPAGVTTATVVTGYSADGGDAIFQLDDVSVAVR
ncbi:DUF4185 domain-containing protein [Nakamurella aerolata]|uniref:DUF4185 domain-containing protein n=1 Tax=Nakamurella aerolata TaxID=1656892 RepID=A0A849A796_9ACTN|nr:DUF4185 domain-containing protein [Nakamurella aerolata]NNG36844.1 hypothetical protein [Nakamurella aerolata]